MNKVRKLKGLKSQLSQINGELEAAQIEVANKQREYSLKFEHAKKIKQQIELLESDREISVSEHAIIRYLERVKGVDIEILKNEILTDQIKNLIETLGGNGTYPSDKGFKALVKDFTITTII